VLLLAAAILLIVVGGLAFQYGRLVMLADLDGSTLSLLEALDWSFMHMLDPGTLAAEEYDHRFLYVSGILITLLGIIITSTLIGLISSSLTDRMESLRQGVTAVRERDHILLLGWSMQALSIVQYFMTRNTRRTVVILSKVLPDDIDLSLRRVGLQRSKLPLVIRTGDSTVADELDRVAVKNAAAIIVVGAPDDSSNSADVDATVLKTIMTIKSHLATTEMPNMVAEISDRAHRDVADVATGNKIPYLIRRDIESRLLVQLCRYPGLGYVFGTLWGDSDFKITLSPARDFSGTTFAEVTQKVEGAAVIGISWKESDEGEERDAIVLNPPADYDLDSDDNLILVTSSNDRVSETHGETPVNCVERMSNDRRYGQYPRRLLILGCNGSIDEILIEYDTYAFRGGEVHILASEGQIDGIDLDVATLSNTAVHYHKGDTRRRDALVSMDLYSFDVIMVLAELEHTGTNDDAVTILTLLLLNGILSERPRHLIIFVIKKNAYRDLFVPDL
jgi:hypothetical protein